MHRVGIRCLGRRRSKLTLPEGELPDTFGADTVKLIKFALHCRT